MTLLSGERQVAPTMRGIRADHVARYRFAAEKLRGRVSSVLDAGCGVGYGAMILGEAGLHVYAWDHDAEAVAYAREHYAHERVRLAEPMDICRVTCWQAEAAVALEVLEHLERPGLALIRFPAVLIASVPNAAVVPKTDGSFPHHVRHYTPVELELLLMGAGYRVMEWWSQRDTGSVEPVRGSNGRTILAVAER